MTDPLSSNAIGDVFLLVGGVDIVVDGVKGVAGVVEMMEGDEGSDMDGISDDIDEEDDSFFIGWSCISSSVIKLESHMIEYSLS